MGVPASRLPTIALTTVLGRYLTADCPSSVRECLFRLVGSALEISASKSVGEATDAAMKLAYYVDALTLALVIAYTRGHPEA